MSGVGRLSSSDPLFRRALLFSLAVHLATLAWVQAPEWEATPPLSVIDARLEPLPESAVSSSKLKPMALPTPTPVQTQPPKLLPVPLPVSPAAVVVPAVVPTPVPASAITPVITPTLTPVMAASSVPTPSVPPLSRSPASAVAMTAVAQPEGSEAAHDLPDAVWYPARKLDTIPKRLGKAEPVYPESARRRGYTGSVKVRLQVNALGEVEAVEIVSAQPEGAFEDAARAFFKAARYQSPQRDGRPVRAIIEERIRFSLRDDF